MGPRWSARVTRALTRSFGSASSAARATSRAQRRRAPRDTVRVIGRIEQHVGAGLTRVAALLPFEQVHVPDVGRTRRARPGARHGYLARAARPGRPRSGARPGRSAHAAIPPRRGPGAGGRSARPACTAPLRRSRASWRPGRFPPGGSARSASRCSRRRSAQRSACISVPRVATAAQSPGAARTRSSRARASPLRSSRRRSPPAR